ncbi:N-acetylmuramoyl-L-alanine amidase family protein [Selenihalanaerobacter shriftii]|uniref:N-acetylmuramoyl-L-alanine amidase n=1 Tax=Selenihalanaerobacter shriftii TaxID=142842 RepID=A0A1T4PTU8_9FIRM|nr:N-acetylmuramoyl-L-alanine amidase family protein [Selenihalanaerobacter shriftii]SJZ94859.1 N-acetylmuramoyl-L-alanine amidase [Selenihalanaerobacter shriftii]
MNIRYRLIIILVIVVIIFSFSAEAKAVNLVIDGQKVDSNLMVLIDGSSLVSTQIISKYLGEEFIWNQDEKEINFNDGNLKIRLPINKKKAIINSRTIPLSIGAKLINGQVMIPLRFLPKIYGGQLIWSASDKTVYYRSNQVTDISVEETRLGTKVFIEPKYLPQYEVKHYHNPERLVIDLKGMHLGEINDLILNNDVIKQIRISQFQVDPAIVRIVVDLKQMKSYQVKDDGNKLILDIKKKMRIVTSSTSESGEDSDNSKKDQGTNYKKIEKRNKRIIIDPGHGGSDPGAVGVTGLKEKKVNYQIASRVVKLLKEEGFNVMSTRRQKQFISLSRRAQLANSWSADLFISIHANYNNKSWINGTATYAYWNASKDNWALAWYVQDEMVKRTGLESNGLKAANFAVLRETYMPAILIETAFLSNQREEYLLNNVRFQNKVAEGIVAGIKRYYVRK